MKEWIPICIFSILSALILSACGGAAQTAAAPGPEVLTSSMNNTLQGASDPYTTATPISEVIDDPAFGDCGRLIFPVNDSFPHALDLSKIGLQRLRPHLPPRCTDGLRGFGQSD